MFGRKRKIRKAIEQSLCAALDGETLACCAPIEQLRPEEQSSALVALCQQLVYEELLPAAEAAARRAVELEPDDLDALDTQAEVAAELGEHGRALEIYRRMYELAPGDVAVISGLCARLLTAHHPEEAVELLESIASWNWPDLQLLRGEALYAADRTQEALALLEQVHDYYEHKLKTASFVDNFEAVKNCYERATRLRDDVYAELHGREAAIVKHATSGALNGRAGVNYRLLGASLVAGSDHEPQTITLASPQEQRERAELLLALREDDATGLVLRGQAELREGNVERAIASFEAATASDGQFFAGFVGLGAALDCEAFGWFKKAQTLPAVGDPSWLQQVVPDWPVLTEFERRVVWASAYPLRGAFPLLAERGAVIRVLPIDVVATNLTDLEEFAGHRFPDDHRTIDAIDGLAVPDLAIAKIEGLLDVTSGSWTFAHELAHLVFFCLDGEPKARVLELYEDALATGYAVTEYQMRNPDELFAVAYADYLRQKYPLGVEDELDETEITAELFTVIDQISAAATA